MGESSDNKGAVTSNNVDNNLLFRDQDRHAVTDPTNDETKDRESDVLLEPSRKRPKLDDESNDESDGESCDSGPHTVPIIRLLMNHGYLKQVKEEVECMSDYEDVVQWSDIIQANTQVLAERMSNDLMMRLIDSNDRILEYMREKQDQINNWYNLLLTVVNFNERNLADFALSMDSVIDSRVRGFILDLLTRGYKLLQETRRQQRETSLNHQSFRATFDHSNANTRALAAEINWNIDFPRKNLTRRNLLHRLVVNHEELLDLIKRCQQELISKYNFLVSSMNGIDIILRQFVSQVYGNGKTIKEMLKGFCFTCNDAQQVLSLDEDSEGFDYILDSFCVDIGYGWAVSYGKKSACSLIT